MSWTERTASHYLALVAGFTLLAGIVSLVRIRGEALHYTPFLFFAAGFAATLVGRVPGLLVSVFVLTIGSCLHMQINALFGSELRAWSYPGVEAAIGFLLALVVSRDRETVFRPPLGRFPSIPLLLLHGWVVVSTAVAIARNLWQSGSEFTLRGLWFNTKHLRSLGLTYDYFPLHDLFFVSVAILMLFASWNLLLSRGRWFALALASTVAGGAAVNALFALWQQITKGGWFADTVHFSPNASLPDLHSFAALMSLSFFLAIALLAAVRRGTAFYWLGVLATFLLAAGIFLSQSRGTLFVGVVLLLTLAGRMAFVARGAPRLAALALICMLGLGVHALLTFGYRGRSYANLVALMNEPVADVLNALLSGRLDIWAAALRMYEQFPLFGLGQGAFFRLSAVEPFSGSPLLAGWGGENAHNWFLQTATQLGPIGVALLLSIAYPCVRVGRGNSSSIALFALLGMAAGNFFGHALLIGELLVLTSVMLALYYWEAEQIAPDALRPLPVRATQALAAGFVVVGLLAAIEVAASFQRLPFEFARRCHEPRPLEADGWAGGVYRTALPKETKRVELDLAWGRPDAVRRALVIDVEMTESDGRSVARRRIDVRAEGGTSAQLAFDLPPATSDRRLISITSSHCYAPFSVGRSLDPRLLGVQVRRLVGA